MKFKCADVGENETRDLSEPIRFTEITFFFFLEPNYICFCDNFSPSKYLATPVTVRNNVDPENDINI